MRVLSARRHRSERGVGLLEVLITVVVLSIGFLAAGGMQLGAMRANQEAYRQSQARLMLDDMMDRMRNNPLGVQAGAYDDRSTSDAAATDCTSTACDPTALAAHDLAHWRAMLATDTATPPLLPPSGDGTPAVGSIGEPVNGVYTLVLSWKAPVDGEIVERRVTAMYVP